MSLIKLNAPTLGVITGKKGIIIPDAPTIGITQTTQIPETLQQKLTPSNNTGLGSQETLGNTLNTGTTYTILDAINTYLINKITDEELDFILTNKNLFQFQIGVGDRRGGGAWSIIRFTLIDNWNGEDVINLLLTPEVPSAASLFQCRLTYSSTSKTLSMTDQHTGASSKYGAIRYFTLRTH